MKTMARKPTPKNGDLTFGQAAAIISVGLIFLVGLILFLAQIDPLY